MDGLPPTTDASRSVLEEAALAASSSPHHDAARDENAIIVPFRRVVPADTATPALPPRPAPPVLLAAPPVGTLIPDYMRRVVADVVARCAPEKNVPLVAAEADAVVSAVLNTLDLADLYRLSMGEPATLKKAGQLISDTLDQAALQRLMLYVRAVENKENAHDPAVVEIVTAVVEEIASATASGPIIWPEMIEAVTKYYGSKPSVMVRELPDGLTATSHWLGGKLHRDEQDGPAVIVHVAETGALRREAYFHEGKLHRESGPADVFHDTDGTISEYWSQHGVLHRDMQEGPAIMVRDAVTGALLRESYFHEGALHREAGPADTYYDPELGMTDASWYRHGKLHRDPREGPAREYRDDVRSWSQYSVDDVWHRPASEGPAFVFSHWEGQDISGEEYAEHGVRHRPASDGPALRCIDRTGNPIVEIWCERGERHRDAKDGPAYRSIENGHRIEEYYRHGKLHRNVQDGPAMIARNPESGARHWEAYYHEGEPHRDLGPADTLCYPNGTIAEYWYRHGVLHRDEKDGPALIVRDENGAVIEEFWYRHNDPHRDPRHGPAHKWCCSETGQIHESYHRDGLYHRDPQDGPAMIVRDAAGAILEQEFWVAGERIDATDRAGADG